MDRLVLIFRSEVAATTIVSDVASVPFYESTQDFSGKIRLFFQAVQNFDEALEFDAAIASLAFGIMARPHAQRIGSALRVDNSQPVCSARLSGCFAGTHAHPHHCRHRRASKDWRADWDHLQDDQRSVALCHLVHDRVHLFRRGCSALLR